MDRILNKFFYIAFQVLKVLLIQMCKIQLQVLLFLAVFISLKTISFYCPSPNLLSNQNPLSVTKVFCQCSLTYHSFSRLLCYDGYDDA